MQKAARDLAPKVRRLAFVSSKAKEALTARDRLIDRYGDMPPADADVIVALGGDGLMLKVLHRHLRDCIPIYGMSRGSVGFLMNEYRENNLIKRLRRSEISVIHPLHMVAVDNAGVEHEALSINEVSLFRQTCQAGKLKISIDGKVRLPELVCDGIIVATPAGSTAYNLSVHGPILPLNAPLLALSPISPFRPRRWPGAVLPNTALVKIEVLECSDRPMSAVANQREYRCARELTVSERREINIQIMFDNGHALGERILSEQFRY